MNEAYQAYLVAFGYQNSRTNFLTDKCDGSFTRTLVCRRILRKRCDMYIPTKIVNPT